jgi:hypothetical protein
MDRVVVVPAMVTSDRVDGTREGVRGRAWLGGKSAVECQARGADTQDVPGRPRTNPQLDAFVAGLNSPICRATLAGRLLAVRYGSSWRVVEPYVHGRSQAGDDLLFCWQRETTSLDHAEPGWRTLRVDRVTELEFLRTAVIGTGRERPHVPCRGIARVHCVAPS